MQKVKYLLESVGENSLEASMMNYKDFTFLKPESYKNENV